MGWAGASDARRKIILTMLGVSGDGNDCWTYPFADSDRGSDDRRRAGGLSRLRRSSSRFRHVQWQFARKNTIWNQFGRLAGVSRACSKIAQSSILGLALIAGGIGNEMFAADAPPFNPVRKLTGWYTDRNLIDVEVVATSGDSPDARFLQPRRALGFRLERAYVIDISWREGPEYDFSNLSMMFDSITGLPSVLFPARAHPVDKRGDDIPQLTHEQSIRRTLIVNLRGSSTEENLKINSAKLNLCRGSQEGDGLFQLNDDGSTYCHVSSVLGTSYVAVLPDSVSVRLTCTDEAIGCRLKFPFEGFAPSVGFHRDHLADWKNVIDQARAFLRAKKYQ
jgi:hypothetical protein